MIRFRPLYHNIVWGGRRFAPMFGRTDMPEGPIGESWELAALDADHVRAASSPYAGEPLDSLWRRGVLDGKGHGSFPLLMKWIDSTAPLSLQVHPDAEACARLGNGAPKTEVWYVAHAEPHASMWVGHREGFHAGLLHQAAYDHTLPQWMHQISPQPGDMLVVPAGMVHAVGPGYVLLEVQQPSRSTFRIYDWQRSSASEPARHQSAQQDRALNLDDACQAIHFERHGPPQIQRQKIHGPGFDLHVQQPGDHVAPGGLRIFVADAERALLENDRGTEVLGRGDVVVAEPRDGVVRWVEGRGILVVHTP